MHTFRFNHNSNGGDIRLFVQEDIPVKLAASGTSNRSLCGGIKLRNQNWLIGCSYNPDKSMISQHMEAVVKNMVLYPSTYENLNFWGDFNADMKHSALTDYFNLYCLTSLINKPTCWKNQSKPTFIDLILTNESKFFSEHQCYWDRAIWLSVVVTVMKTTFRKLKSKKL